MDLRFERHFEKLQSTQTYSKRTQVYSKRTLATPIVHKRTTVEHSLQGCADEEVDTGCVPVDRQANLELGHHVGYPHLEFGPMPRSAALTLCYVQETEEFTE